MNRIYRVIWSKQRNAFVVADERAKSNGKPSSLCKSVVATAVVMALAAEPALAGTSCVGGSTLQTVAGTDTSACILTAGDSLTVTGSIAFNLSGGGAVSVSSGQVAGYINNAGTISNTTGYGVAVHGFGTSISGGITNSGTIGNGNNGLGIYSNGTVSGGITNSGTIGNGLGVGMALFHGTVTGGITNSGTISSSGNTSGIQLNTNSTVTGGITNTGTIKGGTSGTNSGIYVDATSRIISTVSGGVGIADLAGGTISGAIGIQNLGLISGDATGIALKGAGSVISGGITNSGTISSTAVSGNGKGRGIEIASGASVTGGISNSGTITGTQGHGIEITQGGNSTAAYVGGSGTAIYNSGLIQGGTAGTLFGDASGIRIDHSTISGAINNAGGTISGAVYGIYLHTAAAFTGNIVNTGLIRGVSTVGVLLNHSTLTGAIQNSAGATITGGNTGIKVLTNSTITGGVSSSGTISGGTNAIYVDATSMITNAATAIFIKGNVSGNISNRGTISSTSNNGINLASHSTVTGGITNTGTITGPSTGIKVNSNSTITGGITNSGTISTSSATDAIAVGLASKVSGGVTGILIHSGGSVSGQIANSGTISGGNTGIKVISNSTITGAISSSGTISGGTYAIHVDGTSTLSNIYIGGNNTAKFSGDVYAQNTPVVVATGQTFTGTNAFNVQSFTINSTATFNMTAMPTLAAGTAGITVGSGFSNAGTLVLAAGVTGNIAGNYTQTSTGAGNKGLSIGVASQSSYGQLAITGSAALGNNALIYVNVSSPGTALAGTSLSSYILTATGGITGNHAFTVTTNSTADTFTASVVGNVIDLSYTAVGGGGSGGAVLSAVTTMSNSPGKAAGAVFDTLSAATGDMGTVYTDITALPVAARSAAVTQTLPLMTGGMAIATTGILHGVNKVVQARQGENAGLSSGDDFITDRNAWVKPIGSWAKQGDNNGVSGYKAQTSGMVFGADTALTAATRIGVALAATHSNVNNNLGSQAAGVSSYQAVLYGSRSLDDKRTELNWQADYGTNQNSGNRNINFMARTAAASYASDSYHVGAGLGHTLEINESTSFTPFIHADYTRIHNNGYTETGAGSLNLVVNDQSINEFIVMVDGKMTHKLSDTSTLTANLGVSYDTQAKQSSITAAFQGGGTAFTTLGLAPSPLSVSGGLGMVMKTSKAMEITARYDIETRSGFTGQTISTKVRWPF